MKTRLLSILGILLLGLSGCNSTLYDVGSTPLTLSPIVAAGFEKYKNSPNSPVIFVIDTQGRTFSSSYCPHSRCVVNHGFSQIQSCESRAIKWGAKCKVFAVQDQIVWKGPIFYPSSNENEFPFTITGANPKSRGGLIFSGIADVRSGNPFIYLQMRYGGSQCDGKADKRDKTWRVACRYAESFMGTFIESSKNLFEGIGKNSKGITVDFTIYRKPEIPTGATFTTQSNLAPAAMSVLEVCKLSFDDKNADKWSINPGKLPFVLEAQRRGFTPEKCREHIEKNV